MAETQGIVFIVDDEPMVTSSLKAMLALDTPYAIHCFNSPLEALEKTTELKPDVVVSDFSMPGLEGITFLQKVKELLPEATLMLLTGYADKESAIKAINTIGIYRYIEKPWDNDELKLSIHNGIERANLISSLKRANQHLEKLVEERTHDLQVTYKKLQSIVRNSADGIITVDNQLRMTSVNPTAECWLVELLKTATSVDLVMKPIADFLVIPETSDLKSYFESLDGQTLHEAAIGNRPLEVSIAALPDSEGYVLILRDITQRKEIERLRDDFVSTLTHDLRTPLLAAIQTLGFFVDGTVGEISDRQKELLTMLIASNQEMLGLVNVLLEVYKYEAGQQKLVFTQVDVGELIQLVCSELGALAHNREQELTTNIPKTLPSIRGDKQELRRVFMNLIGNAIHYTPAGGKISVSLSNGNNKLLFAVEDTGRGIPAQDIPKLFQRFSQGTSKQRSSGSGLGLYLSRQIVEAHSGQIGVESEEGKGSRFFVSLPV